mgnify:CR=1 FL=1
MDSSGNLYRADGNVLMPDGSVGRWCEEAQSRANNADGDGAEEDNMTASGQEGAEQQGAGGQQGAGKQHQDGEDLTYCGSWSNALGFAIANSLRYFKYDGDFYSTTKQRNVSADAQQNVDNAQNNNEEEPNGQVAPAQPEQFDPRNLSEYGKELYAMYGNVDNAVQLQSAYINRVSKDQRFLGLQQGERDWIARNIFGVYPDTGKRLRSDDTGVMMNKGELQNTHNAAGQTFQDDMRPVVRQWAAQLNSKNANDTMGRVGLFKQIVRTPEFLQLTPQEQQYLAQLAGVRLHTNGAVKTPRDERTGRMYNNQQRQAYRNAANSDQARQAYQQQQQQQAQPKQEEEPKLQQVSEYRLKNKIKNLIKEMMEKGEM